MFDWLFAKSIVLENGVCTIDGVVQSSTQVCNDEIKGILGIIAAILIPLLLISLVFFVFWIITLIHSIKNENVPNRVFWIVAHIVSFFIGLIWLVTIIYYFAVMRPYKKSKVSEVSQPPVPPSPTS